MDIRRLAYVAVVALVAPGVGGSSRVPADATKAEADSIDGIWLSDGYGILTEIHGRRMEAFQITAISCLPLWTASRQPAAERGQTVFKMDDGSPWRVLVNAGSTPEWKHFRIPESAASTVRFRRLDRRPAVCSRPIENTPISNFDVFWETFAEHYPFFAARNVDWKATRTRYRPKITPETTRSELFRTLRAMVEPLHDGHVSLSAKGINGFVGGRPDPHRLGDKDLKRVAEVVEKKCGHKGLRESCNGRLAFGHLPGSVAYLRIVGFGAMTADREFAHGAAALEESLDEIFRDSGEWRGLVVDVRVNRGGSDVHALTVASRLATQKYIAYTKRARNDPQDPSRLTPPQACEVSTSTRPHFGGRVILLTSRYTVSAGETFTMALMGRTPGVVRVGENTQGIFSDVLRRDLPNGFGFGLPNEVFLTEGGKVFEGDGIPPHHSVPVFPEVDLKNGTDQAIEKAIELLAGTDRR